MRLNGEDLNRVSELAQLLPVQLITPESFRLLLGGPKERRQFFDMGLFHVEQSFYSLWSKLQRVLKHRNALLKTQKRYNDEYAYWDQNLASLAFELQALRQRYILALDAAVQPLLVDAPWASGLTLQLYSGWPERIETPEQLQQFTAAEFSAGFAFRTLSVWPAKGGFKAESSWPDGRRSVVAWTTESITLCAESGAKQRDL